MQMALNGQDEPGEQNEPREKNGQDEPDGQNEHDELNEQNENDEQKNADETQEYENNKGFMESLQDSIEDFSSDLVLQEEAANFNSSLISALADDAYIDSDQVLAGKGGWLFYKRADDGTSMGDYQGTSGFSEKKMKSIMDQLIQQRDAFAEKGIRFVVMIIPNKEIIYSEYMPSIVYRTSEITRCDLLYEYLTENSDLEIVYPKAELLAAKTSYQVYYKYDTPWNYAGVYVGVQCLLRQLYDSYEDISQAELTLEHSSQSGDLAALIGMTDKYSDDKYYNFSKKDIDPAQVVTDGILLVGDSFGELMSKKLGYYCDRVNYVGVWTFKMSMLDKYQPDVIIWEGVERYADRFSWIVLTDD